MTIFLLIVFSALGCSPSQHEWEVLDEAVSTRNVQILTELTHSGKGEIKEQAFRALISSQISSDTLLKKIKQNPDARLFKALMVRELSPIQNQWLIQLWPTIPDSDKPEFIHLLGTQADLGIRALLTKEWLANQSGYLELPLAMALGRQAMQLGLPDSLLERWVSRATANTDEKRHRAYLYGAYRARHSIIKQPYDADLLHFMQQNWTQLPDLSRQYFILAVAKQNNAGLLDMLTQFPIQTQSVQVQLDWVKAFALYMYSPLHNAVMLHLLESTDDLVLITLFEQVSAAFLWNDQVKERITEIVQGGKYDYFHPVSMAAKVFKAKAFNDVSGWNEDNWTQVVRYYPHVLNKAFELNSLVFSPVDEARMIENVYFQAPLSGKQSLVSRYKQLLTQPLVQPNASFITKLMEEKDRGALIEVSQLMHHPALKSIFTVQQVLSLLKQLDIDADIEVYQAFFPVLMSSTVPDVKQWLDSLATIPNQPLITSLVRAGYQGKVAPTKTRLAKPNRNRLNALGKKPIWTLETTRGIIKIQLEPDRAPTTVWLIDSLSNAGLFDNVPFHRVVPNFVVQGGDFERGDGYGGSETIIPTEASDLEFERGAVGMASAGTDTESAQYFIMHQWQPHLNYRYTRFGFTIAGMEIADKLIPGDNVLKSTVTH